jgi:GDPmannose 4,6-dehydratase
METKKVALICGINGQDGSYLAQFLLGKGYSVFGTSRRDISVSSTNHRKLGLSNFVTVLQMEPRNMVSVRNVFDKSQPDEVYYLAGQSSVGLSFDLPI